MIQKNWDVFQTALCQPARSMNTQTQVFSNMKYWCFSSLLRRRQSKMITLLIRLLSNLLNFFKKNNPKWWENSHFICPTFFFFFWECLLFALKLSFSEGDWKTDIQQGIKAFFRRPSTHYGYCQEIIPNTLILKKAAVTRGKEVYAVRGGRCVLRPAVSCF